MVLLFLNVLLRVSSMHFLYHEKELFLLLSRLVELYTSILFSLDIMVRIYYVMY